MSHQPDFFETETFEVRRQLPVLNLDRFRYELKIKMNNAIRNFGGDRQKLADEMARQLHSDTFSKGQLDHYTAPSKTQDMSLIRFKVFTRVVQEPALWDFVVSDEGLTVLAGDEARLAEIALLQQRERAIKAKLRRLRQNPVFVSR